MKARVCVRQSYYSVPARFAGRRLQVHLGARTIDALADGTVVATHTRSLHKYTEDLQLDHYLEVLTRKPGALAGATALAHARASGAFTKAHQRFWDGARTSLGDAAGTRALVGVLLLHRTLPGADVIAAMGVAVELGTFDADVVAVHARQIASTGAPPPASSQRPAPTNTGPHRPWPATTSS